MALPEQPLSANSATLDGCPRAWHLTLHLLQEPLPWSRRTGAHQGVVSSWLWACSANIPHSPFSHRERGRAPGGDRSAPAQGLTADQNHGKQETGGP